MRKTKGVPVRSRYRSLHLELLEDRRLLAVLTHSIWEQIVIEMINRARANPTAEAARLDIGLNDGLAPNTISTQPKPPLAPNELLYQAARAHSVDMIVRDFFDHVNPDGKNPGHRIQAAGYAWREYGENIALDFSPESLHDSLFRSAGHRINILRPSFREVGVGLEFDGWAVIGTEKFARRDGNALITGVVFSDQRIPDDFLSYGESLAGITVTAQRPGGALLTATTGPSGAYSIQAPAGTYTVRASGPGLPGAMERTVALGSENVKVDFTVPFVPPAPDRFEPNDSIAQATDLGSADHLLENLSIHSAADHDYFRWTSPAAGAVQIELLLHRDGGDLDLIVYDASGNWLASSETLDDVESVTVPVQAGTQLYIHVFGYEGEVHRDYDLRITGPSRPTALDDRAMTVQATPVAIALLANDSSSGAALLATSVEITSPPAHGQVQWDAASAHATYVPAAGFLGLDRFRYTVRDAGGAISNEATVHVTVVDPEGTPWQNPRDPADVNGDGEISAVDVLTVINDINRNQSRLLPAPSPDGDFPLPYLDVNGDGYVSPADALLAINSVNRRAGGSGEAMVGAVGEAFDPRPISPAAPPITDPPAARPLADGSAAMARRIGVGEFDRGSLHPAAQPTATMAMLAADAVLRAFAAAEDWWEDFFDPLIMSRTPRQEVFSPDDIAIAQP